MSPMNPRLLRPRASGAFGPRTITGLELWLDASDRLTVFDADTGGENVTDGVGAGRWEDKSGNARNFTQSVANNRPVYRVNGRNGLGVLEFDGSSDRLVGDATQYAKTNAAFTAVFVHIVDSTAGSYPTLMSTKTNQTQNFRWINSFVANYSDYAMGSFQNFSSTNYTAAARNTWRYVLFEFIGSSAASATSYSARAANVGLTRATSGTFGSESAAGSAIGSESSGSNLFKGQMAEILIYNKVLSSSEIAQIEGYLAWKWGLQSQLPYNHPYAASFPGYGSQTMPTDSDALTYLAAVATADGGTGVEVGVANAVDSFVKGCKADGIWSAIKASCILSGARTLSGALVPLAGSAPTNNNFVSADYNRKTGLVGNASNKALNTNFVFASGDQNSAHMAAYVTTVDTSFFNRCLMGAIGDTTAGRADMRLQQTGFNGMLFTSASGQFFNLASPDITTPLLFSLSRTGTTLRYRIGGATSTIASTPDTPTSVSIHVNASGTTATPNSYSSHRIAFYSIGSFLDLALLNTRIAALYTAIGAAIP